MTSTGPATSSGGTITQDFSGTIEFSTGPLPGAPFYLVATFTDAPFSGSKNAASLNISSPELTLSSDLATLPFPAETGMSISFSGITPPLSIAGDGSVAGFTGQNAGTFSSTLIPEPSSVCLASFAVVIGAIRGLRQEKDKELS